MWATPDSQGRAFFGGLESDGTYYAVEFSAAKEYPNLPEGTKLPASAEALDQQLVDAVSSYHYEASFCPGGRTEKTDITATLEAYNNPNEEPPETVVERYGNDFRVKQHMINYRPWARFEYHQGG